MKQQSKPLALLVLGWSRQLILPVQDANTIFALLLTSGAVRVDTKNLGGKTCYVKQDELDTSVQTLQHPYVADWPVHDRAECDRYENYLKTKRELVGDAYIVETYTQYLHAVGEGEAP